MKPIIQGEKIYVSNKDNMILQKYWNGLETCSISSLYHYFTHNVTGVSLIEKAKGLNIPNAFQVLFTIHLEIKLLFIYHLKLDLWPGQHLAAGVAVRHICRVSWCSWLAPGLYCPHSQPSATPALWKWELSRDSHGITKLPLIQLNLPYKSAALKVVQRSPYYRWSWACLGLLVFFPSQGDLRDEGSHSRTED